MGVNVQQLGFERRGKPVLSAVNFSLQTGKILVVFGPSGSGKSTLLRLVAGLEQPGTGRICLQGRVVADKGMGLPPHERHCALIFQDLALWPHMTVLEHLEFVCRGRGQSSGCIRQQNTEILRLLELEEKTACRPDQLSGGEQQRLAIGRAIAAEPDLLLLDEPLSNLDSGLRRKIMALLLELRQGKDLTMIHVSHSLEEVVLLADYVLVLEQGQQLFYGTKETFVRRFAGRIREAVNWFTALENGCDE